MAPPHFQQQQQQVVMSSPALVSQPVMYLSSSTAPGAMTTMYPLPSVPQTATTDATVPHRKFARFGVEVAEGAFLSQQYGEPNAIPAVRVVNVSGPCEAAGLQPGDLISSIDGKQVATLSDFNAIVSSVVPKSEVKVVFERAGELLGTDVLTEETTREPIRAQTTLLGRGP